MAAPAPVEPVPPARQPAMPATVSFAQGQLRIDAQNSSLTQILTKVSNETGLKVTGLNRDTRIYGKYGPGAVDDTLTALLDGAGYDYVLIGGGAGRPNELLLIPRAAGSSDLASSPNTTGNGVQPPGTTAPAISNPSEPPHPKTPQEIFEELRKMHPQ